MKKGYIALILVMCLLIVATVAIFYIQKKSPINTYECTNLTPNETDDCYAQIAIGENNASLCDKIQINEGLKSNCYINVAVHLNDSAPCGKIQDSVMEDLCYGTAGSVNYNPAICEKIQNPDMKNQCFATAKNDTSFCSNIKDSNIKVYPCSP